ncbi:hypothetical protein [Deinococcus cellulosilyticus]|uniref:Uncharacterized protein n=1 Tax=Deinococcus cellulosilyticus (strain DSM 18568 / NBRC 106333 / KACC 11606 / 5516J-15) TaxID=1223518 RepID=A0A511N1V9_DEIC1|nr:hypothetical protein [Deinococcus cellulosilyticus]GEM46834.1 hypothetical protein DC3_24690 [Deinococcus cellulosilyticus NBRC 106333 = KACC 11606]
MSAAENPIHHFYDVSAGAAQDLLRLAHLSFEFGSRNALYRTDELKAALQALSAGPAPQEDETVDLIEALLLQAARSQHYQLCILQKLGSPDSGWVCLIPDGDFDQLQLVVQKHRLCSDTLE